MSSATRSSRADRVFHVFCALCATLPLAFGAWFVLTTLVHALPGLSSPAVRSGLVLTLVQSARTVGFALALALPVGIAAAVHLEHYAARSTFTSLAERSIALLAAVPSVLYGLFGVALLSGSFGVRSTRTTAAFTLAVFLFPVVVVRARAALRTVPPLVRDATLALGADPWRALVHVVLPLAMRTLIAEVLLVLARALGTAAPLLVVDALSPPRKFTIEPLAVLIFHAATDPATPTIAAAAVVVLLGLIVVLHALSHALSTRRSNA